MVDRSRLGCDASLILNPSAVPSVEAEAEGMRLLMSIDRPCVQLYTSITLGPHGTPLPGPEHAQFAAFAIEAQDYPDAATHSFPSVLHSPDSPYTQVTKIDISPV